MGTYVFYITCAADSIPHAEGTKVATFQVNVSGSGPRGPRGFSTYELAQQDGFTGTYEEWVDHVTGEYTSIAMGHAHAAQTARIGAELAEQAASQSADDALNASLSTEADRIQTGLDVVAAASSAGAAAGSASAASTHATNASNSASDAADSAGAASGSASAAAESATTAGAHASTAGTHASNAAGSAAAASTSESNAAGSATAAANSASAASTSATNAASSAGEAEGYRDETQLLKDDVESIAQSIAGGMFFAGDWDASGGTFPPAPTKGSSFWKVSVEGTLSGRVAHVGDTLIYNNHNSSWIHLDTQDQVVSVNGKTGAVELSTTDILEGTRLYFTAARAVSAIKADGAWKADQWDQAFGWGNHASEGYLKTVTWDGITDKPSTFPPSAHNHDGVYEPAFSKATAFNRDFGSTANTVTEGNDPRLSDAREWSATVVSQEEAEAGTATTARKWTAQRVRQAIDAAWGTAKAALLGTQNTWTQPQIIHQGVRNAALSLHMPTDHALAIEFATGTDSDEPVVTYLGVRTDGTLRTGPSLFMSHVIHTTNTLPVRSTYNVENFTGNGVTLAEDERAALELGPPVSSANAIMRPGRNRNIMVNGGRTVVALSQHFGTGATASMTIRSNNTNTRTIRLDSTIINKSDYDETYGVTNLEALYLEGRFIEQGFVITYLTMIPIIPEDDP